MCIRDSINAVSIVILVKLRSFTTDYFLQIEISPFRSRDAIAQYHYYSFHVGYDYEWSSLTSIEIEILIRINLPNAKEKW